MLVNNKLERHKELSSNRRLIGRWRRRGTTLAQVKVDAASPWTGNNRCDGVVGFELVLLSVSSRLQLSDITWSTQVAMLRWFLMLLK